MCSATSLKGLVRGLDQSIGAVPKSVDGQKRVSDVANFSLK